MKSVSNLYKKFENLNTLIYTSIIQVYNFIKYRRSTLNFISPVWKPNESVRMKETERYKDKNPSCITHKSQ